MNPFDLQICRSGLKNRIREFFASRHYCEVETPIMVTQPGTEVYLQYFACRWTDHRGVGHPLFLRSSPELHMKQLLALGAAKIFQFAASFRNGGEISEWHHPEFTMLEWYQAEVSIEQLMTETEDLLRSCASFCATQPQNQRVFAFPNTIEKMTVAEAFARFASIDLMDQDQSLAAKARSRGYHSVRPDDDFETAYFKVLIDAIEPELKRVPVAILYDFPPSQAALATVEGGVAKRFEFYVGGVEVCNAFQEVTDYAGNYARIAEANSRRLAMGREATMVDQDFLNAFRNGFPKAAGNALGFDRILALFLGYESIAPVIPFRGAAPYRF
jgi:lysyl-tRNA synthetase class 2